MTARLELIYGRKINKSLFIVFHFVRRHQMMSRHARTADDVYKYLCKSGIFHVAGGHIASEQRVTYYTAPPGEEQGKSLCTAISAT